MTACMTIANYMGLCLKPCLGFQQVFSIKPIEDSPQCICWVPHSTAPHEDTVLFGDDQGYVNVLTLAAKDLTVKSAKQNAQTFSQTHTLEPSKLT